MMYVTTLLLTSLVLVSEMTTAVGTPTPEGVQAELDAMKDKVSELVAAIGDLSRQAMGQQFAVEESLRASGDSGIKVVRGGNKGPQNYYGATHIGGSAFASVHDHSNTDRTIGMGELAVVLNGVEFRTRHNDYKLVMPSTASTTYHETEPIPFPDVPESVTSLENIEDQIQEMREWFKAFKNQDSSVRDYRQHFKPVLCYLEGTWTLDKDLEEPFQSDRHHLDASSWFELMENVRYTSYTGTKNRLENFAYLPTAIMSVNETTGLPNYAQWNYRILCNPIKQDIPTKYLQQVEDLSYRFPRKKSEPETFYSRAARFRLYENSKPGFTKYSLIDEIFSDIPGKDNVPGDLREDYFGETMYRYDDSNKVLNAGFYHRWFKFTKPGAMGLTTVARGFNDENLWVAMTTQNRVAPMALEICKKRKLCQTHNVRFSFAIPLEIIYLTPLLSWNPYNLYRHDSLDKATADGRNGKESKPLDGTDFKNHYITPAAFFKGKTDMSDPADTVKNSNYVLDQDGNSRVTVASGTRNVLQEIEGVGKLRLRYPIAPVHGEGSSVWKELNALRDYVKELSLQAADDDGGDDDDDDEVPEVVQFETSYTNKPVNHFHTFQMSREVYLDLKRQPMKEWAVTTAEAAGHTHELMVRFNRKRGFEYATCDKQRKCWDKHPRPVLEETNPEL